MTDTKFPMRINTYLAHRGFSTRKEADVLIEKGLVRINGRRAVLGDKVHESDGVDVQQVEKEHRYIAYNKPRGVITHSPQLGEKDIATSVVGLKNVFPIGRLDKASHGLIILTDDARITDRLLSPKYLHEKEYRVSVRQELPSNFKKRMEAGVNIEGYKTKKCRVDVIGLKGFHITLTEGKKHQIRRMCAALAIDVVDLERTRIMNIKLGQLAAGTHRSLEGDECQKFLTALGLT